MKNENGAGTERPTETAAMIRRSRFARITILFAAVAASAGWLPVLCSSGCRNVQATTHHGSAFVGAAVGLTNSVAGTQRARPAPVRVRHSSDFGWTAGQDVTDSFAALLASKARAGAVYMVYGVGRVLPRYPGLQLLEKLSPLEGIVALYQKY